MEPPAAPAQPPEVLDSGGVARPRTLEYLSQDADNEEELKRTLKKFRGSFCNHLEIAITKRPPTVATLSSCGPPASFQLIRNGLA